MISLTSYFDTNNHVGRVFGISVTQPKGYEFPTFQELVPPSGLVWRTKAGEVSWDEYTIIYIAHLNSVRERIIQWLEFVPPEEFTLCCWERKPERCHRSIAACYLESLGYEVYLI